MYLQHHSHAGRYIQSPVGTSVNRKLLLQQGKRLSRHHATSSSGEETQPGMITSMRIKEKEVVAAGDSHSRISPSAMAMYGPMSMGALALRTVGWLAGRQAGSVCSPKRKRNESTRACSALLYLLLPCLAYRRP